MCHVVHAELLYLFMDRLEEVGDQWILGGDLGGDLVGDFVAGFRIGNVDVPIFVGGEWSRDFCPSRGARGPPGSLPSIEYANSCQ